MKKFYLLPLFIIFIQTIAFSQSCLPGDNNFYSQSQIDNFKANNPGCTEIEGSVSIYNSDITNLDSLSVLTSIWGNLSIMWANSLKDLSGLDNIDSIGGDFNIGVLPSYTRSGNDSLINLDELNNLTSIGGSLYIGWNASLVSIEGLNNLSSIGGSLSIEGNATLVSLEGLNITSVESLNIHSNSSLPDLTGLENLVLISDNLDIGTVRCGGHAIWCAGNTSMITLDGLNNLSSIGGDLIILCNDSLTSLESLENLTSIAGDLNIGGYYEDWNFFAGNPAITTLAGLDNITSNSIENLTILGNYSLTNCEVQSICDYLDNPNGTIEIHDNATGCNNTTQVNYECTQVSVQEIPFKEQCVVHPNPFTTSTTIEYELSQSSTVQISIFNHLGKQVDLIKQPKSQGKQQLTWDASRLPSGVYYFRMKAGKHTASGKLILVK
ncbi:MAG: T9SS type A sorting domain-containing protein [Bacteroidetes bacterium]|nr:T9SS type A sorting domain-containing protein [Bacteroidota bacterium]